MTEDQAITQTADKYRNEGYTVVLKPDASGFPEELRHRSPAMLATRNGTSVLVEIWSRDRINELPPSFMPPGWQFDIVSLPSSVPPDAPGPGPAATPEYTRRLLSELEDFIPRGAPRAQFLIAWSAVESAMRVAAQRAGLDAENVPPRQLIGDLVSQGVLSQEQYNRLRVQLSFRNRVAHGVPTDDIDPQEISEMVRVARELITDNAVQAA